MLYLDANSTSRLRKGAISAVTDYLREASSYGNPSSVHGYGRRARDILESCRENLSAWLGLKAGDAKVVFTSGGTEACNLLVHGFLGGFLGTPGRSNGSLIASAIEHVAILEPLRALEHENMRLTLVLPNETGICGVDDFFSALSPDTQLVAMMLANNETGAIQPVAELARALRKQGYRGATVSDCSQAFTKYEFSVSELFDAGVNAVSFSGQKIGAPVGTGAVIFNTAPTSADCRLVSPLLRGGPQEEGYRGGAPNLSGIAGLNGAIREIRAQQSEIARIRDLREALWNGLAREVEDIHRITPFDEDLKVRALSNTLSVKIVGMRGDDFVVALDLAGLAASNGSACSSGTQRTSHVLTAQGFSDSAAREVIRLSLDWDADQATVDKSIEIIASAARSMRRSHSSPTPSDSLTERMGA